LLFYENFTKQLFFFYTFEEEKNITVKSGDILYLAQNAHYDMYIHDDQYRFIYCDFSFEPECSRECAVFSPGNPSYTENLFIRLLNSYTSSPTANFADILSTLYTIYSTAIHSQNTSYLEKTQKMRIEDAKQYINAHCTDPALSVSALAASANMSDTYFRKLFCQYCGQLPSSYITAVRLQKARELMQYPFLSLEECAVQSGFSSQQYFCRVFRQQLGITPIQYRKKLSLPHRERGEI